VEIRSIGQLASIVIFLGVAQFFFLTFLAAYFYPGGFDYLGYYFSDLGALVAKNGEPNTISSTLFSITVVTVAITLIPFWLVIRSLFTKSRLEKILSILGFDSLSFPDWSRYLPNRHSIGNSHSNDLNFLFTLYVSFSPLFNSCHI